MNVIDNDKLSATIKAALADAQERGVALEDHEAALLHDLLHGALTEAATDVSGVLKPLLEAVADLQITINTSVGVLVAESAAWRAILQRFNLSPPETPK
jgi:hypothetical protein